MLNNHGFTVRCLTIRRIHSYSPGGTRTHNFRSLRPAPMPIRIQGCSYFVLDHIYSLFTVTYKIGVRGLEPPTRGFLVRGLCQLGYTPVKFEQ